MKDHQKIGKDINDRQITTMDNGDEQTSGLFRVSKTGYIRNTDK